MTCPRLRARVLFGLSTLFILLVVSLGGCGGGGRAEKKSDGQTPQNGLTVVINTGPLNMDPRLSTDAASGRIDQLAIRGLLRKGKRADMEPDLAEKWEVTPDGLVYTFHLRPGLTFHDGRPLTSADVAYTFNSVLDPALVSPKRPTFSVIEKIETPDASTAIFRLGKPYGSLVDNMTLGILPVGTTPEQQNAKPVGAGPFRIVEMKRDESVALAPFDKFYGGAPKLAKLVFRIVPDATVRALEMRKGTIGLAVNQIPYEMIDRFKKDPELSVVAEPGGNYTYLAFNLDDPILKRPQVRRAIALAIDRQAIVDAVYGGYGVLTESILPPFHWAHASDIPKVVPNPAEARRLLDEAGLRDPDGDGPKVRFTLTQKTSTDEARIRQAEVIQAQLKNVGIGVDIRSFEFATFFTDIKNGNFQIYSLTYTGISDPEILYNAFHSDSIPPNPGANRGRYRNPQVDALIMKARHSIDQEERIRLYREIQHILARDLPYVSLWNEINVAVMTKDLRGFELYPSGELYSLQSAALE